MSDPVDDPAWPLVLEWSREATNEHRLVQADDEAGQRALAALEGVTEWSVLGALARHAAVLAVQDWLFVLGAGGEGHPGLQDFNGGPDAIPGALIAAVDVLGGAFVINGGGLEVGEPGEVCFLAPDTLDWIACEMGHSAFVRWTLTGDLAGFYEDLRWPGWQERAAALAPGEGIFGYPPPFAEQGRGPDVHRTPMPLAEVWSFTLSAARQLAAGEAQNN